MPAYVSLVVDVWCESDTLRSYQHVIGLALKEGEGRLSGTLEIVRLGKQSVRSALASGISSVPVYLRSEIGSPRKIATPDIPL